MTVFTAIVRLIDDAQKRTSMTIHMGDISDIDLGAETLLAQARLASYITDLKAITLANVEKIVLKIDDPSGDQDSGVPSTGSDVSEELVLNCHTNDSTYPTELDQLRVPSPVATVWIGDDYANGFDVADADASNFVDNFASALEFSDGEHVNTAEGTDGIESGFWRSRKMQVR